MTPYHYSIVRCRDASVQGEVRNVGLLVIAPSLGKAWLRRGALKARAHLVGDDAAFVRALLDGLEEHAKELARSRDAASVQEWLRSHARPTEDGITLAKPAIGIADDLADEVKRLRTLYLGRAQGGASTAAERVRHQVLRVAGLARAFTPRSFPSGPATWRFPAVADAAGGPLVFNALHFGQTRPEGVLDAAFKNVGRVAELLSHHEQVQVLTVATGPSGGDLGAAFERSLHLMEQGGLNLRSPNDLDGLVASVGALGVGADGPLSALA
jgi:hypothetical protein